MLPLPSRLLLTVAGATLSKPGQSDRMVALHRRDTAELLAEELRRLDPDEVYAEALGRFAEHPVSEGVPT